MTENQTGTSTVQQQTHSNQQPEPPAQIETAAPQYAYPPYAPKPYVKPENAFKPDMTDFIYALFVFALGYIFVNWVLFNWQGWGVTAFTAAYLLSATSYLIKKNAFVKSGETIFWLSVTMLTGLSYTLWDNAGFNGRRSLFLFCLALYYIVVATGSTLTGKTSNYFIIDGLKAVIIIPFRNFINQYVSFKAFEKSEKRRGAISVLIGLAIAVVLLVIVIPLLRRADSGGFALILDKSAEIFSFISSNVILYIIISIPVSAYIYGLVSGTAHKKGTDTIKADSVKGTAGAMRILQSATIYTALGAVCAIYVVFIASQLPYFFSAFTGSRPQGWLSYSEYARQGFFELSAIASINLAIITTGNIVSKKPRAELRGLKVFNIIIAAITIILIATAFSKMVLYIDAFGLTMRRLLPCVFMVFMAVVFVALMVLQKWDFSLIRFSLITGCAMMCVMCLANPDALVVRYNAERYLSGTLAEFDTEVLRRAGYAGVLPALEVIDKTTDEQVKMDVHTSLTWRYNGRGIEGGWFTPERFQPGTFGRGIHAYSVESYVAIEALKGR